MIFLDSNVPMYLVGAQHPNKERAELLVHRAVVARERLVTDAEVFQEILHRYVAIDRREAIEPAFELMLRLVDEVFSIELWDVEEAKALLLVSERLSARDAVHVAVMRRHEVPRILTFDTGFDGIDGLTRLS